MASLSRSSRRLTFLFVAAVLLPCAVLVVLTLLAMRQEQELAAKRVADQQAAATAQARQALRSNLEAIVMRALQARGSFGERSYDDSAVVFVASLDGGRLALPWGHQASSDSGSRSIVDERTRRAEALEFRRGDLAAAVEAWRQAASGGGRPEDRAYTRLGLARVLTRQGRKTEATSLFRAVLEAPATVVDEHRIPFSLYAAAALAPTDHDRVSARLDSLASVRCCLPPEALYMLRDIAKTVDSTAAARGHAQHDGHRLDITDAVARAEQVVRLQNDFGSLGLAAPTRRQSPAGSPWVMYGEQPWLLTVASGGRNTPPTLVAVDAARVVESVNGTLGEPSLQAARLVIAAPNDSTIRSVGADVAGIGLSFDAVTSTSQVATTRFFYIGALVLVVGVALFGAYFLTLDVRREIRLAETRSHFVASVSHELKTPLTAIRMFAESLAHTEPRDEATRREYLDTIVGETERLSRLLNNVLDLSKIERGQKYYRFGPANLGQVAERSARTLQYSIDQQGFRLRVETEDDLPAIAADEDAIEQAVLNLLTNAMKYSGDSRDIELAVRRENGSAVIAVADRGIGISRSHQAQVREKFYRAPVAENAGIPGTGLGLTIVDHIAKAHGGRLEIASETGRGTVASLYLPLTPNR